MRPRSRPLTLALLATAIAGLAAPARAQDPAGPAGPSAVAPPGVHSPIADAAPVTVRASVLGDAERRQASPRRRADSGPFNPLVGKPDYGTAENGFGASRSGHVHAGQDVFAPAGRPLVAVDDSIVVEAGSDGGRGNHIALHDRKRDRTYVYFHMQAPAERRRGDTVKAGERVGAVGCTGSCWGDHLHFEVRDGRDPYGRAADPMAMLADWKSLQRPR